MQQKLIATTTLGSRIVIGEHDGHTTHAKPGKYNVYEITRDGESERAIVFVHESEVQDVNELLKKLKIVTFCGVDFASYGIQTVEKNENWSYEKWIQQLNQESNEYTDGFVTNTNYGDGLFTLYDNEKHSIFLLDDEDIYIQELAAQEGVTDFEWVRSYTINKEDVEVEYYSTGEHTAIEKALIGSDERNIDVLVKLLKQVHDKVK